MVVSGITILSLAGVLAMFLLLLPDVHCPSQLCHLAAVTTAQRAERVVYFDTTNTFSAGKVKQMTDAAEPQVLLLLHC